jgi:adenosylmethionine-8-amino-7-oxononanoate aminotransferase
MHGPTFMANPLACRVAIESIRLLLETSWQDKVATIERQLVQGLGPCREMNHVADVRVLGAIGVVELKKPVVMDRIQAAFVRNGVWVRPFGKLVYLMPPYCISDEEISLLTSALVRVVEEEGNA